VALPAVDVVERDCLDEDRPPPRLAADIQVRGPESECPEPWVTCLSAEEVIALSAYIDASVSWMRDAVTRCGPVPSDRGRTIPDPEKEPRP
jgi:hypothetical protein